MVDIWFTYYWETTIAGLQSPPINEQHLASDIIYVWLTIKVSEQRIA